MWSAEAPAPSRAEGGRGKRDLAVAAAAAAALVAVYSANGEVLPGTDAVPNVYLAANLVEEGRLAFTAARDPWLFAWTLATPQGPAPARVFDLRADLGGEVAAGLAARGALVPEAPYFLVPAARPGEAMAREYVGRYGVGAALTAVPVLAAARTLSGDLRRDAEALWHGAKLAASLLAALGAAVLYLTLRQWLAPSPSLLLATAYALGTPVWSLSSQTLWQHASNELFLALGAYFLLRRERGWSSALAGLSFAAAAACRPTSALFAVAAVGYLAVSDRRSLLAFLAGCLPLALALGAYNQHFLGSPFRFGQSEFQELAAEKTGVASVWQANPGTALAGLLLSPSRGLLVFSPFLALAAPGAWLAWRRPGFTALRPILLGAALVLAVDLAWFDWWGGWSYGWRRLVDLAPAFTLFLVPAMGWVQARRWRTVAFALLVSHSVVIQAAGALAYDPEAWNARRAWRVSERDGSTRTVLDEEEARRAAASGAAVVPIALNVDEAQHRHRLWSVRDSQLAYLLGHFGEARRAKRDASRDWISFWSAPGR